MTDVTYLALAVLPSLLAAGILLILPRRCLNLSLFISIGCSCLSALSALMLLINGRAMMGSVEWLQWSSGRIEIGYFVDPLAATMLACVAVIGFLVQLYSFWYMKEDPAKRRFFATISFFTWAMLCFVISSNLFGSYIFWELLGFSSYLLIGFWHERPEPRRAAIKAFVMTRFGDLGFLAAVILIYLNGRCFDFQDLYNSCGVVSPLDACAWDLAVCLLFLGVIGKSAQFPLSSWLPDAMEGPTPVSALIHSATMVAAGVYLLVRLYPLIALSHVGMTFILVIGALTSCIAAFQALNARDMKRILAYSTVSQLGFMVMAIGAGAVDGAMFHLLTHAVFKSMLFLLAGYFISVAHHKNDIFEMAKLPQGAKSRWMLALLWIGGLSLAGLFPFAGFLSKESIFAHLLHEGNYTVYGIALFVSFLTAYYTVRMMCVVSRNGSSTYPDGFDDANPSKNLVGGRRVVAAVSAYALIPVTILGLFTVIGFWALLPQLAPFFHLHTELNREFWINFDVTGSVVLMGLLTGIAFFGIGKRTEAGFGAESSSVGTAKAPVFGIDAFWNWVMRELVYGLANLGAWCEKNIINAAVNGIGRALLRGGQRASALQGGQAQAYLLMTILGIIAVILYLILPA